MNIKRQRKTVFLYPGTFDITKDDLVKIEKIILKHVKPTDLYITLGKMDKYFGYEKTYSSARYIRKTNMTYHYAAIRSIAPNILVEFTPFKTTVVIHKLRKEILKELNTIADELARYFATGTKKRIIRINRIVLN